MIKGILLAGGHGTRLYPATKSTNKHLLAVYDKPMVYYPLSILMLAGIKEILIISTSQDIQKFKELLGDGEIWGISLQYKVQISPDGIAQAFTIAKEFIGDNTVCMILGDNIFYGQGFSPTLKKAASLKDGALIFGYKVKDPQRFGVIEFDKNKKALSIEEKPQNPKSNYAVTGLYFYDNDVIKIAQNIKPSLRGELEITSINEEYLKLKKLKVELLGRGFTWLDAGTHDSLMEAGQFVQTIEHRQGYKIACLEEIAYNNNFINKRQLNNIIESLHNNNYAKYLQELIK